VLVLDYGKRIAEVCRPKCSATEVIEAYLGAATAPPA